MTGYFNEDNVTEQMCIEVAKQVGYKYVPADELREDKSTVIVESLLMEALIRINGITEDEARLVIERVRTRIAAGMGGDIITANQALQKLFFEQNSFPFGKDGEDVTVNFFDTDPKTAAQNNTYIVTNQWEYPKISYAGGKRLDIVLLINGIPMVIGEVKTPVHSEVTWADGAKDISDYQKSIPEMFVPNILSFSSEGKELYYAGIGAPLSKWGPWFANEERQHGTIKSVKENLASLIDPLRLLEIYRFFSVYTTDKNTNKKMYNYMVSYLLIITTISSILFIRMNTKEALERKKTLWHYIKTEDSKDYKKLIISFLGIGVNLPFKFGRKLSVLGYKIGQKIFGFN